MADTGCKGLVTTPAELNVAPPSVPASHGVNSMRRSAAQRSFSKSGRPETPRNQRGPGADLQRRVMSDSSTPAGSRRTAVRAPEVRR